MTLTLDHGGVDRFIEPVYNVSPNPGAAAKLGFSAGGIFGVQGNVSVRPGDYGLETTFENVDEGLAELDSLSLTVWGVPAASIHDPLRWNGGVAGSSGGHFGAPSDVAPVPFFTNPTTCATRPLAAEFLVTSWEHPNASESPAPTEMPFGPLAGCDRLGMKPSLTGEATTSNASAPSGLDLDMNIPQTYDNAGGLATSTLKRAVVTLPEGMTVNPSAGAGLQACSEAEYEEEAVQFAQEGQGRLSERVEARHRENHHALVEGRSDRVGVPRRTGAVRRSGQEPVRLASGAVYLRAGPGSWRARESGGRSPGKSDSRGSSMTTFDTTNVSTPHTGLPPLPFSEFLFRFNQGANFSARDSTGVRRVHGAGGSDALLEPRRRAADPVDPFVPDIERLRRRSVPIGWCPAVCPGGFRGHPGQQRGLLQPA